MRRTKIVATIGPASDDPAVLRAMIEAGMDMARISLAHGPVEAGVDRLTRVRRAAADAGRIVGVLADLPGPKIRAAPFVEGGCYLAAGDPVSLAPAGSDDCSDTHCIGVNHATLLDEIVPGDRVALGDGGVLLEITDVGTDRAVAVVRSGGTLQGSPGVNLPPRRSSLRTPTAEDLVRLKAMIEVGADAVAVSFVQSAADIEAVRTAAGPGGPMLVAKIETPEAVEHLDAIIEASDGVMVARGDLGVRCALEDVPHHQKRIIRTGVAFARPVITATQMLESMITAPTPTRAEVSDVANSVADGTSAVMLSGETAIGHDPALVVRTMSRIVERAEAEFDYVGWGSRLGRVEQATVAGAPPAVRINAAISGAAWRAANDAEVTAVIACSNSGATARAISRFRPTAVLIGATPSARTARQLSVAWGVQPLVLAEQRSADDIVWFAVEAAVNAGYVKKDDVVAVLVGSPLDPEPTTDILRLVRVR